MAKRFFICTAVFFLLAAGCFLGRDYLFQSVEGAEALPSGFVEHEIEIAHAKIAVPESWKIFDEAEKQKAGRMLSPDESTAKCMFGAVAIKGEAYGGMHVAVFLYPENRNLLYALHGSDADFDAYREALIAQKKAQGPGLSDITCYRENGFLVYENSLGVGENSVRVSTYTFVRDGDCIGLWMVRIAGDEEREDILRKIRESFWFSSTFREPLDLSFLKDEGKKP